MRWGLINLILGIVVVSGALGVGVDAFATNWRANLAFLLAGVVNVGIGVYILTRRSGDGSRL